MVTARKEEHCYMMLDGRSEEPESGLQLRTDGESRKRSTLRRALFTSGLMANEKLPQMAGARTAR